MEGEGAGDSAGRKVEVFNIRHPRHSSPALTACVVRCRDVALAGNALLQTTVCCNNNSHYGNSLTPGLCCNTETVELCG